jgi:hypothetical protein
MIVRVHSDMGYWAMVCIPASDGKGLLGDETEVVVRVGSGILAGSTCIGEPWCIDGDGGNGIRYGVAGSIGVGMWGTAVGTSSAEGLDEKKKVGGL